MVFASNESEKNERFQITKHKWRKEIDKEKESQRERKKENRKRQTTNKINKVYKWFSGINQYWRLDKLVKKETKKETKKKKETNKETWKQRNQHNKINREKQITSLLCLMKSKITSRHKKPLLTTLNYQMEFH